MKTIRFSGLVRLANGVHRELCSCMAPRRREELRQQVHRAIELVERTLATHGANLRALPGPSRRAYEFLRTINFDHISQVVDAGRPPVRRQIVLRGLVSSVQQIADHAAQIANGAGTETVTEILRLMVRVRNPLETYISRADVRVEELTPRSREHLAWLRYFADSAHIEDYLAALRRADAAFEPSAPPERWPRPIVTHFRPTHSVFRVRAERNRTRVLLPIPMIGLSNGDFHLLARALFGRRSRRHNAQLHSILLTESYQELRLELEALGGIVEETRGMVHDLEESFHRVNREYFAGRMPRPRLTWNRCITAGKFGHYHYATDTVMISRALDRAHIPSFVIDHVMHHELLHKKHGLRWHRGRSHAHTPEFRNEERSFARYREADQYLQALAAGKSRPQLVT